VKVCLSFLSLVLVEAHWALDVHMLSPHTSPSRNLQGASHTVGGFSRGRALGNTYSHTDAREIQMDLDLTLAVQGKVYIYNSLIDAARFDLATAKPSRILKVDATPTFAPVLTKLVRKYSPVRRMFNLLQLSDQVLKLTARIKCSDSYIQGKRLEY
jgi:hypothetical protein